jgi:glycosyl transferase, family 25
MAAAVAEKTRAFFEELNNFFDHIYVITLERATDRHAHVETELAGLDYQLFYGKDKDAFQIEQLAEKNIYNEALARQHHRYNKPMRPGEIGCAWSHAEVYKDVLSKGYGKVLVLEDDVVINRSNTDVLTSALQQLPSDWGLVYFGFAEREGARPVHIVKKLFYHFLRAFRLFPFSHKTIKNLYPKKLAANIYRSGYHDCTHAYGLTRKAAEELLRLQQPISFIADNLLAHAITNELVRGYIIQPKLIDQQYQVGRPSASYLNQ